MNESLSILYMNLLLVYILGGNLKKNYQITDLALSHRINYFI